MDGSEASSLTSRMEADGLAQWVLDAVLSVSIPAAAQGTAALEGLRAAALQAVSRFVDLGSSVVQTLSKDPLLLAGQSEVEKMAAQWRWSGRSFGSRVRLPLSVEIDERLLISVGLAALQYASTSSAYVDERGEPTSFPMIPPTTLALALACLGVFYKPGGVLLNEVCLSPFCVVEKKEYIRLFLPALVHVDAAHLLQNLAMAVPECAELERQIGSHRMALELVVLTGLSHSLYVGWTLFEKQAFGRSSAYYSVGAVGLSSLALAVQVTCSAFSTSTCYVGFVPAPIPRKYMWAVSTVVSRLASPDSSLAGHLCGVAAGLLHAYVLVPALRALAVRRAAHPQQQQPRFYGSGTWGGSGAAGGAAVGGRQRGGRWRGLLQNLKELGVQVALAAAVVGVCALANTVQRPVSAGHRGSSSRRPMQLWPATGGRG